MVSLWSGPKIALYMSRACCRCETDSSWVREELGRYQSDPPCETCHGKRLKPEALAVKVDGMDIAEVSMLAALDKLQSSMPAIPAQLTPSGEAPKKNKK